MAAGNALNVWIPASAFIPRVTNGPSVNSSETTTNRIDYDSFDFDPTTSEAADALILLPSGGTFVAEFYWTADSGSGDVVWAAAARAFTDDDALDSAVGTAQQVADTLITAGDLHDTSQTPSVTVAGVPASGNVAIIRVTRLPADAGDTLGVDARLLGVRLTFAA